MAVSLSIEVNPWGTLTALDAMPGLIDAEVQKAMVISTHIVEAEIKALTPRRTGRLFSSWEAHTRGLGLGVEGIVSTNVSYAGIVEQGSPRHVITAHGRALMIPINSGAAIRRGDSIFGGATLSGRLRAGQQFILRKRVTNPGFEGRHMARRGLRNSWPLVREEFVRSIKRAVDAALGIG